MINTASASIEPLTAKDLTKNLFEEVIFSIDGHKYEITWHHEITFDSVKFKQSLLDLSHIDQLNEYCSAYYTRREHLFALRLSLDEKDHLITLQRVFEI